MHIILTGATGSFTLPSGDGLDTQKAQIIVHDNFSAYPSSVTDLLQGADGCVWAQGISQTQVSKEEYVRITHDYPLAAAKAFSTLSKNNKFNFVYVSGEGADPTEKTFAYFGKIKGRAEAALTALSTTHSALRLFNVRPGYVAPGEHKQMSALSRAGFAVAGSMFKLIVPNQISPPDVLAKVLVDIVTGDGNPLPAGKGIEDGGRTVRCIAIRKMGGL
ncbi:ARM repeat-containing protein [Mycena sanguinolenta]|uniref:ARM repeat-containing protein n=1 Tax=Mycena sanguinolenta TaxID=230812 RepID=A0A8H6XA93_9AGAR|nr:ARM repeat-containing protein [Mycena sanguinolenta]